MSILNVIHIATINKTKLKIYKDVLRDVCDNFDGAKQFINERIKEICSLFSIFDFFTIIHESHDGRGTDRAFL